jgi:periplasmic protein CpxP/Spy
LSILCRRCGADRRLKQFAINRSGNEIVCNRLKQTMASSKQALHPRTALDLHVVFHGISTRKQRSFTMNEKYSNMFPRRVAATLAAVVVSATMATGAVAMPWGGDQGGKPGDRSECRSERGMKGMSQLHTDLKLDAKQEALWTEAEKASTESMVGMRDRFRQHQEEIQALIDKPGADLRAVAKRMDEFKAEGQKLREVNRDRWLTVYDSLNAEQKEQARQFFKSKLDRMTRHGHRGNRGPDRG